MIFRYSRTYYLIHWLIDSFSEVYIKKFFHHRSYFMPAYNQQWSQGRVSCFDKHWICVQDFCHGYLVNWQRYISVSICHSRLSNMFCHTLKNLDWTLFWYKIIQNIQLRIVSNKAKLFVYCSTNLDSVVCSLKLYRWQLAKFLLWQSLYPFHKAMSPSLYQYPRNRLSPL